MNKLSWSRTSLPAACAILLAVLVRHLPVERATAESVPPPSPSGPGNRRALGRIALGAGDGDRHPDRLHPQRGTAGRARSTSRCRARRVSPLRGSRSAEAMFASTSRTSPGTPSFAGSLVDGKIKGTFTQGGQSFPFSLGRERKSAPVTSAGTEAAVPVCQRGCLLFERRYPARRNTHDPRRQGTVSRRPLDQRQRRPGPQRGDLRSQTVPGAGRLPHTGGNRGASRR